MIDPSWISGLGVILFGIGLLGAFTRKNAIIVLMCIEVMLNAANLNFVAGASHYGDVDGCDCDNGDVAIILTSLLFKKAM